MGEVQIPLAKIDSDGALVDLWLPLMKSGRMSRVSGDIHLRMMFNRLPKVEENIHHFSSDEPDRLRVTVHAARDLVFKDSNDPLCNPRVKIDIGQFQTFSAPCGQDDNVKNPNFNDQEVIYFDVTDSNLSLKVEIEDYRDTNSLTYAVGFVKLPLRKFKNQKVERNWYKLQSPSDSNINCGEVELTVQWFKFRKTINEVIDGSNFVFAMNLPNIFTAG